MTHFGIIAGKGIYPQLILQGAKNAGKQKIAIAAFEGETSPELTNQADSVEWIKVGQLNKLIQFFKKQQVTEAVMAGQISPKRLYDMRPDWRTLWLLATLKKRNAETLFGAVANELEKQGIRLLPATTYIEQYLATPGWIAGPKPSKTLLKDIEFGWPIVKEISRMDIGQTIVIKKGTVLAVEGFDGTDATIRRGGELSHGGAIVLKVSKPNQDFRFDVPVIGPQTLHSAASVGVAAIVCEANKTLLLARSELTELAERYKITLMAQEGVKT